MLSIFLDVTLKKHCHIFFSLLVSGSDDLNAILWDPMHHRAKCVIKTGHSGNIFSVKVTLSINN